jgi:hypothetical protein
MMTGEGVSSLRMCMCVWGKETGKGKVVMRCVAEEKLTEGGAIRLQAMNR